MSQAASVNATKKGIDLKGSLVFSTVSNLLSEGNQQLKQHQAESIQIDLSDVERVDSAGIALLLEWKRLCDKQDKTYKIVGAQSQIASLITTNKMQGLLGLAYSRL